MKILYNPRPDVIGIYHCFLVVDWLFSELHYFYLDHGLGQLFSDCVSRCLNKYEDHFVERGHNT